MEWLSSFLYSIAEFIPRLLHVTEDMVCLKMGWGGHIELYPGYHFYWPLIHEIRSCYSTRQELDLPEQILSSVDGETVLVSVSIVYRVTDVVKALIKTQDYESTVMEVAQRAVQASITTNDINTILSHDSDFDNSLAKVMQKDLCDYGLVVDNAFFTSAAITTPYHISGLYIHIRDK